MSFDTVANHVGENLSSAGIYPAQISWSDLIDRFIDITACKKNKSLHLVKVKYKTWASALYVIELTFALNSLVIDMKWLSEESFKISSTCGRWSVRMEWSAKFYSLVTSSWYNRLVQGLLSLIIDKCSTFPQHSWNRQHANAYFDTFIYRIIDRISK